MSADDWFENTDLPDGRIDDFNIEDVVDGQGQDLDFIDDIFDDLYGEECH